jgi:hypothetical protein
MARRGDRVQADQKVLAGSACEIITELMGEIHAARIVGVLAVTQPSLFQTVQPNYIVRIAEGAIVLALRKFEDLWNHQIKAVLLRRSIPIEGTDLVRELERRKFRDFCRQVVAHYAAGHYRNPKTPPTKIEDLLRDQGFESPPAFFEWTCGVVTTMKQIRTAIGHRHSVEELKWKPAQ